MAIKGSLKEASLPDVIQLLALGRQTGCLALADRHNFGYHLLRQGQHQLRVDRQPARPARRHPRPEGPDHARSSSSRRSRRRRTTASTSSARSSSSGTLTSAELEDYMRIQIEEAVYFLFTWTSGTFNFEADVRPESRTSSCGSIPSRCCSRARAGSAIRFFFVACTWFSSVLLSAMRCETSAAQPETGRG